MAKKKTDSKNPKEDKLKSEEPKKDNQDWKDFLKIWEDKNIGLNEVRKIMDPLDGVTIRSKILKHNDAQDIIQSASQHKLVTDTIREMTGIGKEQYAKQTLMGKAGEKMKVGPQPKLGIDLRKDVIGMGMTKMEADKFYELVKNIDFNQADVKQSLKQTSHERKTSPSSALVEHINKEGFELKNFIGDYFTFMILGYLLTLLLLSIIFSPLSAFILWVIIGFGIYKSIETYGEEKPWFTQLSEKIQNFGFSTKTDNDFYNEVEEKEEEEPEEEENVVSYDDYAEKFDEWRVTKDTVASPFVSAENKVSNFSFNSDGMYKVRLWLLILIVPIIWVLIFGFVLPEIFTVWYLILGFSSIDSYVLGSIGALVLSYFLIIRIYSHCTNQRKIPFRTDMMADYDPYVVSHLFQSPQNKSTISVTSKALLLDFIGGWFIIIFLMFTGSTASISDIFGLKSTANFSEFFSLTIILILFAVAVPIVEELLFRGLLLDTLSETYGTWTSIIISSVIFAVLHIYPLSILNAFWGGMIYGYLRIRTNSLWPGIILHALWNGHLEILNFFYFV